ncbi:TPA: lytic transglycosylase domain-containing protein [Providencia alcalifaciens]
MATITTNLLFSLFAQCAVDVAPETLHTLIGVESSKNPYAIAVVYGKEVEEKDKLKFKQPNTEAEALKIIDELTNAPTPLHKSYSVGLMQVNSSNFKTYGINRSNMFNACKNIEAGAGIFKACYAQAKNNNPQKDEQELLRIASSCYYSGNETRGFKKEANGTSYVDRINKSAEATYKVPAIKPLNVNAVNAVTSNGKENTDEISLSESVPQNQPMQQRPIRSWDIFEDF